MGAGGGGNFGLSVPQTSGRKNTEIIAVPVWHGSGEGGHRACACPPHDLRRFQKSVGILSTRNQNGDENGLPCRCLHRLRPTLQKWAGEESDISCLHRKGRLLIRFSRLGRVSNTLSVAEATDSWKLLDPGGLREL